MIKVSVREAGGTLSEWEEDETILLRFRKLREQGIVGGALIERLVQVDSDSPPLSIRLSGTDAAGNTIEEFIC